MKSNNLINESSPYLLQHAHNPVNWFPWGNEALEKAASENKILIISIGYAACHWCHVMEKETFENEEAAEIMNEHFVCIKVDREERPDIDHIYMDAIQLMNQRGGWPLNIFALPDGRPFFCGTYFPRTQWMGLCNEISSMYKHDAERITEFASKLAEGILSVSVVDVPSDNNLVEKADPAVIYDKLYESFDREEGGLFTSNKFPMPGVFSFLLLYYYHSGENEALEQVQLTLGKMASGGIYDQLGGGFARYSTDIYWKVPHFEKMLYDNAQLISLYSQAYQVTLNPLYKKVVEGCYHFLTNELMRPGGGFYSSLDADSEGEEGKYYIWQEKEIGEIAAENADLIMTYYGTGQAGLWENGKNILLIAEKISAVATAFSKTVEETMSIIFEVNQKLSDYRNLRSKPATDDKILLSWNCLAIIGFLDAYFVFKDEKFLVTARQNLLFILENMMDGSQPYRNFKNGKKTIPAFLEDYSLLIKALISFYGISFDPAYLNMAKTLTSLVLKEFYDEKSGYFYFQSTRENKLIANKIELADNVISSSNSIMADNLFHLGKILTKSEYLEISEKMLNGMMESLEKNPSYYANWGKLFLHRKWPFYEVAICGEKMKEFKNELEKLYLPNMVVVGSERAVDILPLLENRFAENKTLIYVCNDNSCSLSVDHVQEAILLITAKKS